MDLQSYSWGKYINVCIDKNKCNLSRYLPMILEQLVGVIRGPVDQDHNDSCCCLPCINECVIRSNETDQAVSFQTFIRFLYKLIFDFYFSLKFVKSILDN